MADETSGALSLDTSGQQESEIRKTSTGRKTVESPRDEFEPVYWGKRRSTIIPQNMTEKVKELCNGVSRAIETAVPWLPCFNQNRGGVDENLAPKRFIFIGRSQTDDEGYLKYPRREDDPEDEQSTFCSNIISTTKYTVASFIFINLFEQFQKKANFYFLLIAILSFTQWSPKSPIFSVAPLCFVLAVSAVKEAYEDYKRFEMDKEINNREVMVYRPTDESGSKWEFQPVIWQEVEVGDIVKVTKKHRAFPCDLVLLQSSTPHGLCNIETSNLDGETNLKIKQAVGRTWQAGCNEEGTDYPANPKLDFVLESDAPNEKMDKASWKGALKFAGEDEAVALGFNQMLLRGCTLRNTDWVIGLVLFTGVETKLMLNNKLKAFKRSNVDLIVDQALYTIFVAQAALCIFGSIAHRVWLGEFARDEWYQYVKANGEPQTNFGAQAAVNYLTFMVLLDLFVPISLYVSMELVKFVQAWLISSDLDMEYDDGEGNVTKAQARTSNLNEELGQVDFIFSDKTGTLTQNKMDFVRCHVNGVRYGPGEMEKQSEYVERVECPPGLPPFNEVRCQFTDNRLAHRIDQPFVNEFLTLMAVCHSIIPEYPDDHEEGDLDNIIYQASSPDEKALVLFAKNLHYVFFDSHVQVQDFRDKTVDGYRFYLNIFGTEHTFELYHMLEFTSARKRMSVVVRDPRDGKFKLYCKGADNVILDRLREDQRGAEWQSCHQSLGAFAADGLRTLVCGYRELSEDMYYDWLCRLLVARASFENREELVEACFDEIERDLVLLGATAIEDRLQDGVPDTIANLSVAGISIWVLTGDKVETAINIGRSCKLLTSSMTTQDKSLYIIDPDEKLSDAEAKPLVEKLFDDALEYFKDLENNSASQGLVISGKALGFVFPHRKRDAAGHEIPPTDEQREEEDKMQEKVLKICRKCRAVLCCRVSPKQKSQMVLLVRERVTGTITLAIGDGANDVPMIKAAHVGIGISGQEGLQAVMASDYAIAQFKYLQNLLLIHGAWDYRRTSTLILYSFYKNIMFSMTQIWYSFYSGFSGTLFYDAFSGSCYNLVFTAMPVLLGAVFDRPYSKEIAMYCPELYENGPKNASFNLRIFFLYVMEGVMHSMVIFWGTTFFIDSKTTPEGRVVGFWVSCTTLFTTLVIVATAKMMLETKTWTRWSMIVFFLSVFLWFVFALVWSAIPASWGWGNSNIYQVAQVTFGLPIYWFTVMFAASACLVPEIISRYILRTYFPSRLHVIEELEVYPELKERFVLQIKAHMSKQEQILKAEAEAEAVKGRDHLGYTEFHVDKESPDYIMSQSAFMAFANNKKRNRGLRKLFTNRNTKNEK